MPKIFFVVWTDDRNGGIHVRLYDSPENALRSETAHYGGFRSWEEFDTFFSDHAGSLFDGRAYRTGWVQVGKD